MLSAILLTTLLSNPAEVESLSFVVRVESNRGTVRCAVFDHTDRWLTKKVVAGVKAKVSNKKGVCIFRGLKPGKYAISAYHDENDNGKLDTNFVGIPSEDYVASNDARGTMGPPNFEDAVFNYPGGPLKLTARAH